jgi:uncharacterized integral membrane protein
VTLPVPPPHEPPPHEPPPHEPPELTVPKTKTSRTWVGVGVGLFVLLLVIIFIAQNINDVRVHFLWMRFTMAVGLAISLSFVLGALFVLLIGAARVAQLRLMARRHRREEKKVI